MKPTNKKIWEQKEKERINYYQKIGIEDVNFSLDATGDCCVGDCILFEEAVFDGNYRNAIFKGKRKVYGAIIKDSYGKAKQQHTFTILVLKTEGVGADKLKIGSKIRRKGRNIYRNGTKRMIWQDENERLIAIEEKHSRGAEARRKAEERKKEKREKEMMMDQYEYEDYYYYEE